MLIEGGAREKEKDQVEILSFIEARGLRNMFLFSVRITSYSSHGSLEATQLYEVTQSNVWIYPGHKKNAAGHVATQRLHILNIKGLEAEAQSRRNRRVSVVVEGNSVL